MKLNPGPGSKRILIVEDAAEIRQLVRLSVGHRYEVLEAGDALRGLELLRERSPDLVLLDVMLPGKLDGLGILRAIRDNPTTQELPVVMLTARIQAEDRQAAIELGATAYFTKPFSPLQLADYVQDLLELAGTSEGVPS